MTNFESLVSAGKKWLFESAELARVANSQQEDSSCQLYPEDWYLLEEKFTRGERF